MRSMMIIQLLFMMTSSLYAEKFEPIIPQITKKYLIATTLCYQEKVDKHQREECRPVIKLSKKKKITQNLNRQFFCNQMISNYINNILPNECKVYYCSPCLFLETIA